MSEHCICNTGPGTDGPDETCPQHGRPYSYWVEGYETLTYRLGEVTAERDRLKRGGAELGKSLMFWMNLAVEVTGSQDCIEEGGDGDWGAVAERLASLRPQLSEPIAAECCASGRCEVCSPGWKWDQ